MSVAVPVHLLKRAASKGGWRVAAGVLACGLGCASAADAGAWSARLTADLTTIDAQRRGGVGVYVRDLSTGASASQNAEQQWYLASMVKVPIAMAVLRGVEAYARYYARNLNAATLEGYGDMLEKLVRGKLLSPQSTERVFDAMKIGIFTNYRLQAGLPRNVAFIHKTGTQYQRACHIGVINPKDGGANGIVVATCAADIDEQREAGKVFERVGRAITQTMLAPQGAGQAR